ncbi:MAG: TlpA family protein disulfide reductase [Longimicrobiales bacterium]
MRRLCKLVPLLLLAVFSGCLPDDAGGLGFGDPVPAFTAERLGGGQKSLQDYQGKTLLVNLWATWCGPCRTETPYLQSLFEDYQAEGLEVVGISIDEPSDRGAVSEFVREMGVSYDILLDPDRASEKVFRARGLPNSILIDAEGKVVFSWLGPVEEGDESFLEGLRGALASAGH